MPPRLLTPLADRIIIVLLLFHTSRETRGRRRISIGLPQPLNYQFQEHNNNQIFTLSRTRNSVACHKLAEIKGTLAVTSLCTPLSYATIQMADSHPVQALSEVARTLCFTSMFIA